MKGLDKIFNTISYAIIIIAVAICLVILAANKNSRKIVLYILSCILIVCGVLSAFNFYTELNTTSYINGAWDITNYISQDQFKYVTSDVVFYENNDMYIYSNNLVKVPDYDGEENDYEIYLNDYLLIDSVIYSGATYSKVDMNFYDNYNNISCETQFELEIKFYSDRTELKITTDSESESKYLTKYFSDYGFKLEVIEKI